MAARALVGKSLQILRETFPFIVGLLSGLYFISLHLTGISSEYFPGDLSDSRFNHFLLEHAYRFFAGIEKSFWDGGFMFPETNVISYSDNLLGVAPFYALFRFLGFDPVGAYQEWYLLVVIMNFSSAYFFLKYLFNNNYAAACGAMVFAFSIALQSQMPHAQTFARFGIVLSIWMALRYMRELKPKYFFMSVLFFVYQVYCGVYLGLMLFVPLCILLLSTVFFKWDEYKIKIKDKKWWLVMTSSVLLNLLLLVPLMIPYLQRSHHTGLHSYEEIFNSLLTPRSYFFSYPGNFLWDFLSKIGLMYPAFWDHQVFAGGIATIAIILLCILISVKVFKPTISRFPLNTEIIVLILTFIITLFLFSRVVGYSLYILVYNIPGFGSMRALQRIINVELLFYAVAVSYFINLLIVPGKKMSPFIFIFFVAVIITDNYIIDKRANRLSAHMARSRVNVLIEKMKTIPAGSVVSYEPDSLTEDVNHYQLDAMLASQQLSLKCINAYTADSPDFYWHYWLQPNKNNRLLWLNVRGMPYKEVFVVK